MNSSATLKELATAMAKAQGEIKGALKDSANPFFKSKYADLSSVVEAIRAPLASNGISYVQIAHDSDSSAKIETVILHSSGEWLSCGPVSVPVSKADAQGFGSAMTYARRYSLSAAFGVAPEDDDGNAAASAPPKKKAFEEPHKPTDGAWESLGEEEQVYLTGVAMEVIAALVTGDIAAACNHLDAAKLDNDEKTAIWTRFDSKQRAAMKKFYETRKVAA